MFSVALVLLGVVLQPYRSYTANFSSKPVTWSYVNKIRAISNSTLVLKR